MSHWTRVDGTILVAPFGRTQPEKRYILETVLDHLPLITGSEYNLNTHIIETKGMSETCTLDEFGQPSNLYPNGPYSKKRELHSEYLIILEGDLRDRTFTETYREVVKWLCRLAKRCYIMKILIRVEEKGGRSSIIEDTTGCFESMCEHSMLTAGNTTGEPAWIDYLCWQHFDNYYPPSPPALLCLKYHKYPKGREATDGWMKERDIWYE